MSHYHVTVGYDGTTDVSDHTSFTGALDKARQELMTERLLDTTQPRSKRRIYKRRDYVPGVYADWTGTRGAEPDIRIEVSVCVDGIHT